MRVKLLAFQPGSFLACRNDRPSFAVGTLNRAQPRRLTVNNIIYIVGLVVVVLAVLSFFGMR